MTNRLLNALVKDQAHVSAEFKPGAYWEARSWYALRSLRLYDIDQFRSSTGKNTAAYSLADLHQTDLRLTLGRSLASRLALRATQSTPLRSIFNAQVRVTRSILEEGERLQRLFSYYLNPDRLDYLLEQYRVNESINFGATGITEIGENEYSSHYLSLLDQLDHVENANSLKGATSFLEIGSGFGTNTHLIEQNFQNIRKFLLIDVVPAVYLATEYLRTHYGKAVVDYLEIRESENISFSSNRDLEIMIIPPWKLPAITQSVDYCWNSHSFQEMSGDSINMYAQHLQRLSNTRTKFSYISYDGGDMASTLDPDQISNWFPFMEFHKFKRRKLFDANLMNLFYVAGTAV